MDAGPGTPPQDGELMQLLSKTATAAHNHFKAKISANSPTWKIELARFTELLLLHKDDKDIKNWLLVLCFGFALTLSSCSCLLLTPNRHHVTLNMIPSL
jgi:hypothetical protein